MSPINDHNKIMEDRTLFNEIVYTPLSKALKILEERQNDPELVKKIEKLLDGDIPEIFKNKKCGVLSRHIATPNEESRRFISIAKDHGLAPVFFEFHDDKFTSNNEFKHSLGQIHIQKKLDCNGNDVTEKITIIDFNLHNGKKLKDITTFWNESLIDFHKSLFSKYGLKEGDYHLHNASEWFMNNGNKAINYYANFLLLFTCHGILFENFLISKDSEGDFTKNIVLPAIDKVIALTGVRPLITPLEPLDLENDKLWLHHLSNVKELISKKQ